MFRTTLGADELAHLESQLTMRLAPLREVTPSADAVATARGALLSATAAAPARQETGGIRSWQRGAVIGVAIVAPLAAGGAFAAIPTENLAAVPQFAAQSFVSAISSSGSPASSDVGVLEDETAEGESAETGTGGEEPQSNVSSAESLQGSDSSDPGGEEPTGDTPLVNGELDANATESFIPPGHEVCFEANATARARLAELLEREDLAEDQRAELEASLADLESCGLGLDEEGEENGEEEPVEETPTEEPVDEGNGHAACYAATENARGVLTRLLEKLPPQGAAGVANALAAIERCGLGNEETGEGETENDSEPIAGEEPTATATETTRGGPPPHAGPPEGVGPTAEDRQAGPPENAGPPDHAGPPAGVGPNRDSEPDETATAEEAAPAEDEPRGGPSPHAGPPEGVGPNSGNSSDGANTDSEASQPGSGGGRPTHAGPPAGVGPGSGGGGNRGGGPPEGVGRNR